jgi:hypothetical protein
MEKTLAGELLTFDQVKDKEEVTFIMTAEQIRKILKTIGNDVDKQGYIVDSGSKERVTTPEFEEIQLNKLGAILPGSKIFITKNIASFSDYLVKRKRKFAGG